jgi:hypothetical protein
MVHDAQDFDIQVKLAIYRHFAATGVRPDLAETAASLGAAHAEIRDAYRRLFQKRVLVLEEDGESIRMAPPFSGIPTQHRVQAKGISYYANCAWDALGIPAALHEPAEVESRCEQSREPLKIAVSLDGPTPVACVIHFAVPAARWWEDIVYT